MNDIQYLWSDAWLLQAVALAAKQGPASLGEVLAAADAVNHALPADDELHGGFYRLTTGGFVEEINNRFVLTARVPHDAVAQILIAGWQEGRRVASALLQAEEWSEEKNSSDPRNAVRYSGLTRERLLAADRERIQRQRRRRGGDQLGS